MSDDDTISAWLKARRAELGYTQKSLAKAAGVSESLIANVERGIRNLGADNLRAVALVLRENEDRIQALDRQRQIDRMRGDVDHATIDMLVAQLIEVYGRLDRLEAATFGAEATAEQFASAADTGAGGKVVEDLGTSRRRVTPASGED